MKPIGPFLTGIIMLAVVACGDRQPDVLVDAVATDTSPHSPTAPVSSPIPANNSLGAPPIGTLTPTNNPVLTPSVNLEPSSVPAGETSPVVLEQELAAVVEGNTAFALHLYRTLADAENNIFYSPYSISMAMAMAIAGAGGETEAQMRDTLRFDLPPDRLHPAFNALDAALESRTLGDEDGEFEMRIANSVWGQQDYPFLPSYLDTLAMNYGDEVRQVDFRRQPEHARDQINKWVAGETNGRIEDLLSSDAITPLTRLVLANAVYFKATWRLPFDERATSPQPFYSLDGAENRVPMMRQTGSFGYASGDGYQIVELPYGGGDMSMTVLLPDGGRFGDFEDSLDAAFVDVVLHDMEEQRVRLAMPRFELEAGLDLADALAKMGMPNAFDERRAEFQGMNGFSCLAGDEACLLISGVAHKTFISVDETGTEAVATTTVVIGITKALTPEDEIIEMTIDRPFIFLIRDRPTGSILFLGRIVSLE